MDGKFKKANWVGVDIRGINFSGAYLVHREISEQNFLHEFRSYSFLSSILYYPWWLTCDFGRSMLRWCFWIGAQSVLFAWLFTFVGIDYGHYQTSFSPFYFSVVTLATLGFGDVVPTTLGGQVVVIAEVTMGYIMLGGLLSIFSNKLARRAAVARGLALKLHPESQAESFTAGLLQDMGVPVLAIMKGEAFRDVYDQWLTDDNVCLVAREKELFDLDHSAVAGYMAEK